MPPSTDPLDPPADKASALDPLGYALERLAEVPDGPKPLDVECPHCGAAVGSGCSTATGYGAATHASRWRAVGIASPNHDDRHRNYWDGQCRRLRTIAERASPSFR